MNAVADLNPARLRRHQALAALLCLLLGLSVLVYQGPAQRLVRGLLGDVLVVPFLYFGWGIVFPHARKARALGVGLLALATESVQLLNLVGPADPWWLKLAVGTTFDVLDLLAYTVGLGAAYAVETWSYERLAETKN